ASENIYLAKYHVKEFGENTFYVTASDLSENLSQEMHKLNVQRIDLAKPSMIALTSKAQVSLKPKSFDSDGIFYGEAIALQDDSTKSKLMRISETFIFSASSQIRDGFSLTYDLKDVKMNEDEKRKIGLYRLDERDKSWQFVGGQGERNVFKQEVNALGTYAIFYDEARIPIPKEFKLHQNFPNPFNPVTTIRFDLPEKEFVTLSVYNVLGQMVINLAKQTFDAGYFKLDWDGRNEHGVKVASGIYIYQIHAGKHLVNKKMILIK
ncbi:MAG: T9SS type A sorting domain-containing protein, partial [Calditrichaeota bacterium]|nr:T9SS type A sorting domain-containing protein [Calditrichota bacterium]